MVPGNVHVMVNLEEIYPIIGDIMSRDPLRNQVGERRVLMGQRGSYDHGGMQVPSLGEQLPRRELQIKMAKTHRCWLP